MDPVARRNVSVARHATDEHVLADQRYEEGVSKVVIKRVAAGDTWQSHLRNLTDRVAMARDAITKAGGIVPVQMLDEFVDENVGRSEHYKYLKVLPMFLRKDM